MAKIKDGITSLSGKFQDVVHVQSNKYKPHVRKAITGGGNKDEPSFKAQTDRTTFLSRLASDLNNIMMRRRISFGFRFRLKVTLKGINTMLIVIIMKCCW